MLSVVVPFYNEEESLAGLYKELGNTLSTIKDYEVIFVDDGSTDNSLKLLKELSKVDKEIRIYSFRKNQGKAEALTFGFQKSKGKYVVTLDADLQDKPSEIKSLLEKSKEGWDLVCGWRKNRKDSFAKIAASKVFNLLASFFWGIKLHDYNCGLKVYAKDAAKSLRLYGGLHRFIPLLVFQQGFSVTEVPVEHEKRKLGKSKYGFSKLWKDLPDLFTMLLLSKYGRRPLHFFGTVGFVFFTIGSMILLYLAYLKITGEQIGPRPILFLGMILVLSGLQTFFTGFLAELYVNVSSRENKEQIVKYSSKN